MRQAVVEDIRRAGEALFLRRSGLRHDLARGSLIKQRHVQPFDKRQHGGDARLQVGKGLLVVVQLGNVHAGQSGRHAFGKVGRHLNLAQQWKHVGKQPRLQQRIGVDFLGRNMRFSLGQHAAEAAQHLFEHGNGSGMDGRGHGFFQVGSLAKAARRSGQAADPGDSR